MKRSILNSLISLAVAGLFSLQAQDSFTTTTTTTNTPVSLLSGQYFLQQAVLTATSANATTFKFYDMTGTTTNIVVPAYTKPLAYATNYSTVFTNVDGRIVTNTFSGRFVTTQSVGESTNERTRLLQITVPASSSRVIDLQGRGTALGLAVQSNHDGMVELQYNN